ncbi:MAG TPA: phospho-N-acetylmuramoyl-pentapeptide-transferase [Syntrophomonadaceae bacterium]|jgi:phospho-N-acetylmuramoyl-pentapeptide-transferase|nr:phospho-N-acetylmuramoyl-pentapeptide-transferase [Syntrophomonadaceae bacterium]
MHDYIINAGWAAAVAIVIALSMGPFMIPFLRRLKVGQSIREDGPRNHYVKAGTPTMGGIVIITAVMVASFLFAGSSREVLIAVLITLCFGGIGFWDDYIKVVLKRSLGLRAREKLGLQILISSIFGLLLMFVLERGTEIVIPFSGFVLEMGWLYLPFVVLVLISSANGANLTDGLDGLAAGVTFFIVLGLAIVCIMSNHGNLLIYCGALAGACLGFLFFNRHPARVFMGDTGSMALGAGVASVAAMTHSEIALIVLAGVYVIETLSVIIQVISFQATRRRVFLMAPLHHHFELKGMPETKVVYLFYVLSASFVMIGLLGFRNIG